MITINKIYNKIKYLIKYNETYHVTKCNHHIIMLPGWDERTPPNKNKKNKKIM